MGASKNRKLDLILAWKNRFSDPRQMPDVNFSSAPYCEDNLQHDFTNSRTFIFPTV
jgi:hypothetical protein